MKNKNKQRVPSESEVSLFMEQALKRKTRLSEQSKKLLTEAVISLHYVGLITKKLLDRYMSLTKSCVRTVDQQE